MKPLTSAPKGTHDILPQESPRWHHLERLARETAQLSGFFELRTPTFEHTELFNRAVGDTTDVVQKEMYTFTDKGDRSITLRPEGTAGVLRAAIQSGLLNGQLPVKTSYTINCFRYEKPQAGRLREFHQFGVESLGPAGAGADAEVIALGSDILAALGLTRVKLFINSIGCPACRPAYQQKLKDYFTAHQDRLCPTCLGRLSTNPLRIIDCKESGCKELVAEAPKMLDHLCPDCATHFAEVRERLTAMGIPYQLDPDIVRGLDYYVRTVFEFVTDAIGAQGTVCGGGRYDGLIAELGGPPLPGIGFAMGIERLLLVLEAEQAPLPEPPVCELYVVPMGKAASVAGGVLCERLRREGVSAACDVMDRGLKAAMRYADKLGARYTLVLGDDELARQAASVKEMATGEQTELPLGDGFAEAFSRLLRERLLADVADAGPGAPSR